MKKEEGFTLKSKIIEFIINKEFPKKLTIIQFLLDNYEFIFIRKVILSNG